MLTQHLTNTASKIYVALLKKVFCHYDTIFIVFLKVICTKWGKKTTEAKCYCHWEKATFKEKLVKIWGFLEIGCNINYRDS